MNSKLRIIEQPKFMVSHLELQDLKGWGEEEVGEWKRWGSGRGGGEEGTG